LKSQGVSGAGAGEGSGQDEQKQQQEGEKFSTEVVSMTYQSTSGCAAINPDTDT